MSDRVASAFFGQVSYTAWLLVKAFLMSLSLTSASTFNPGQVFGPVHSLFLFLAVRNLFLVARSLFLSIRNLPFPLFLELDDSLALFLVGIKVADRRIVT